MHHFFENSFAYYHLKGAILYITFKDSITLTYDAAKQLVNDRLRFQSFAIFNVICDVSLISSISSEARTFLSTYGSNLLNNVALVSTTPTIHTMARFYILINKPKAPTKIFHTVSDAEQYLESLNKCL